MLDSVFVLARQVESSPGVIVGPIARVFGFIIDLLFNLVYNIGPEIALGLAIILMTIIFRTAMLPLNLKTQKSMGKMQELKPEVDKINEKYGKTKDPELIKKKNAETQALYAKHGVNPLGGCLPMLIQMPLFFGVAHIMRQAFIYITRLRDVYYELSSTLISLPNFQDMISNPDGILHRLAMPLIPNNMLNRGQEAANLIAQGWSIDRAMEEVGEFIVLARPEDLSRVINRFTMAEWQEIYEYIPTYILPSIQDMVQNLHGMETFFGLDLTTNSGWAWPGIIVPILVGVTMFCATWVTQLRQDQSNADDRMKMMNKMMLVVMPIMLGFFTVNFPIGVGIFWITSQFFQFGEAFALLKKSGKKFRLPFMKAKA